MGNSKEEILSFLIKNKLFEGLSEQQLSQLIPLIHEINVEAGEYIIKENEVCDFFYIVKSGHLEVCRYDESTHLFHTIVTLKEGETVGEIAIIDQGPRSASVRALTPCTLYALSLGELKSNFSMISSRLTELAKETNAISNETFVFPRIVYNLAKVMGKRLRNANETALESLHKELDHEKERVSFSLVIISVVVVLSVYITAMQILESALNYVPSTTVVSAPLIIFFSLVFITVMIRMGYPRDFYGLTLKHWKQSLKDALFITPFLMILIVIMKWGLIHVSPAYMNHSLFEMEMNNANTWPWMAIYFVLTPFQELIVRGILQSSFEKLLISSSRIYWAIILSNLMFSVTHFHMSVIFGFSAFLGGLFWGWSFAKHRTLLGVSISHVICGIFMLYVVGFPFAAA